MNQVINLNSILDKKVHWREIILYSVIVSSFLPKIAITDSIFIYLPEIIITIGLFTNGVKQLIFFDEQKLLLVIFGFILFFSIAAQIQTFDIGAILRSIKEILYIPIIYWASQVPNPSKLLKRVVMCGIAAMLVNYLFYHFNATDDSTFWAAELSSGMSNKAFYLQSFKLDILPGLSHGIWGSYCLLIFIISIYLYSKKQIKIPLLIIVTILFFTSMAISSSREAFLILLVITIAYLIMPQERNLFKIIIISLIALIIIAIIIWGQELPIIQKIIYTQAAIESQGSEGNVDIRVNTWLAYFNFISNNLYYLFWGLGLSSLNFGNHVLPYTHEEIVPVPESAFVYMLAYGGICSFITFLVFIFFCAIKIYKICRYKILKYFFIGVIITNLVSGVSMFSDLLYAHLCLIYGLFILNRQW